MINHCISNGNSDLFRLFETRNGATVAIHTFFVEADLEGPGSSHAELRIRREKGPPQTKPDSIFVGEVGLSKIWEPNASDGSIGSSCSKPFILADEERAPVLPDGDQRRGQQHYRDGAEDGQCTYTKEIVPHPILMPNVTVGSSFHIRLVPPAHAMRGLDVRASYQALLTTRTAA